MFISKKAILISNITKEIVSQYAQQLRQSIEDNKKADISKYSKCVYEDRVKRAERALREVEQILEHFDESMFDGKVNEDGTITMNTGVNKTEKVDNGCNKTREEVEDIVACSRSSTIFRAIGINQQGDLISMYKTKGMTALLLRKLAKLNGRYNMYKVMGEFQDADFPEESDIDFGELQINNLLSENMATMEDGRTREVPKVLSDGRVASQLQITGMDKHKLSGKSSLSIMNYKQGRKFIINADKIEELIDSYLEKEYSKTGRGTEEKSAVIRDLFTTLSYGFDQIIDSRKVRDEAEYSTFFKDDEDLEL